MVTSNKTPRIVSTNGCSPFFSPKSVSDTQEFQLKRYIEEKFMVKLDAKCELVSHTYSELRDDISRLATALRSFGITSTDVVCGFLPNSYQTTVAMFAAAAVGAAWCSASVDFGPSGVLDRFKQVNPKILFTVEAVTYKGKRYDLKEKLNRIVSGLPSIKKVVQYNNLNSVMDFNMYEHGEKLMSFIYCGGSIVLFDESPLEPDPHILVKVASITKSTIIGMGAKLYDEYLKMNVDFKSLYDLKCIRLVYSTGSPLKAAAFEFINSSISPGAIIGSISGGTDIIGCFMGCSLSLPVHPGECQCLYLGMDVKAFDHSGNAVEDKQGELVCLTPFPSMPSHFLGDTNYERYKKAYFERFDGVWAHGDFCQINSKTGGVIMLGRSDATLNRGGVRIGTAEIYSVVETFAELDDCIVAGQIVPDFDEEHILLFVKMAEHFTLTEDLKRRICIQIRTMMSPRHVPNAIYAVPDIPYTNSGKKVELAVKQLINGDQVTNVSSLRNPDALEHFRAFKLN
ncbi:putative acetoacetate-CoA ligase, partial [Teladorsagia circumcincta]